MVLNVAGPLQIQFPLEVTAMSVTNLLIPPAKSSPLDIYEKKAIQPNLGYKKVEEQLRRNIKQTGK